MALFVCLCVWFVSSFHWFVSVCSALFVCFFVSLDFLFVCMALSVCLFVRSFGSRVCLFVSVHGNVIFLIA